MKNRQVAKKSKSKFSKKRKAVLRRFSTFILVIVAISYILYQLYQATYVFKHF
jgi:hypothetical protein